MKNIINSIKKKLRKIKMLQRPYAYNKLFNKEPIVRAIHAGLECGLIGEKYPGMDMISYGPTLRGVHSPDERLEIKTVELYWKHTLEILKNI